MNNDGSLSPLLKAKQGLALSREDFMCCFGVGLRGKLISQAFPFISIAAGTVQTLGSNVVLPTNQGNVIGVSFKVLSNTFGNIDRITLTLAGNGKDIIKDTPAPLYSPFFDVQDRVYLTFLKGGSTFTFTVDQSNNVFIVPYSIEFFFDGSDN